MRFSGALKTPSVLRASMRQVVRIRLAVHKWYRICIAIRYADHLANKHPAIDTGFDEQLKVHFLKKHFGSPPPWALFASAQAGCSPLQS